MKRQYFTRITLLLSVVTLLLSVFTTPFQASAAGGQALEIAPPVVNLSTDPGKTVDAQIGLRNVSTSPLVVTNQINDFTSQGESGTPRIILDDAEETPYSLKSWIRPVARQNLNARQFKNIPVKIDVPKNAAPGGYYAVIRFTGSAPSLDSSGVALSASLGALIFLTVKGPVTEKMNLESFSITKEGKERSIYESAPITFVERIKNTGSIHEQPAGQVTIKNMFGKTIAAVNINLPPRNILPQSIRRFEQPLDSSVIGNKILFGLYTAEVKITYGANKSTLTTVKRFWVIPYKLIGLGIIGLIILFFVLRVMLKRYNNHIIKQSQKKRKR